MNNFFLVLFALLISAASFSQIPGLTQFTTNNGLPSNTVYDIIEDEQGFLWIATDYGISKFDGINFKNYSVANGLSGNEILYFFKDSQDRIWLAAFNGTVNYIKNGKIFNSSNTPFLKDLYFDTFITAIYEDSKGQIWFSQDINNIKILDTTLNIQSVNIRNDKKGLYGSFFIEDLNNDVHLLTYSKKNISNPEIITKSILQNSNWKKFDINQFLPSSIDKIKENLGFLLRNSNEDIQNISNYFKNKKNRYLAKIYTINKDYWVTNVVEGSFIFDKTKGFKNPTKILNNYKTTRAFLDSEKNIWIGSQSNGLFFFPNIHIDGFQFRDAKKNDLHTVAFHNNTIFVGNEKGELNLFNPNNLQDTKFYSLASSEERVRQFKRNGDLLYVLSDYNIYSVKNNNELQKIKSVYDTDFYNTRLVNFKALDIDNDTLITANAGGVASINIKNRKTQKLWNKRSTAISYGSKDSIWIGTTSGLYLKNSKGIKKFDLGNKFNNSIIYALRKSPYGLLIGSNSQGLGILKNGNFTAISKNNGLLSNYIKAIYIDKEETIWLSTNFGLNSFKLTDSNKVILLKSYTTSDGLYSNDVRGVCINLPKVFVATSNGLNIIDLSEEKNDILAPKIHINDILLNNTLINKESNQTFNYNANNIQFNFSGISFKSLGNVSFKYRLKGLEEDWIETNNQTIRYSSLPPNTYTFEIKAISKNKIESLKPAVFAFIITPPFYKTWWFMSVTSILGIFILLFVFYKRNQKIKREEELKDKMTNLKYQALNAQMNPHFINNLLVNLENMVAKGNFDNVKDSLSKFATLVNVILRSTKSNLITLKEEIDMASLYIELQKLRFTNNLTYQINYGGINYSELNRIYVPPMLLQPIIENALKHAFTKSNKQNAITMNFSIYKNDFILCELIDNGIGLTNSKLDSDKITSGISLKNINERLQLIANSAKKDKFVIIEALQNEFKEVIGTKVTLKIPLISF